MSDTLPLQAAWRPAARWEGRSGVIYSFPVTPSSLGAFRNMGLNTRPSETFLTGCPEPHQGDWH